MSNESASNRQSKADEIHAKIQATLEIARGLNKAGQELQEKLLGTATPCGGVDAATKGEHPGFTGIISAGLSTLHTELLYLRDILASINTEF